MADELTIHHLAVLLVHLEDAPAAERGALVDALFAIRRLTSFPTGRHLVPRQFRPVDTPSSRSYARREARRTAYKKGITLAVVEPRPCRIHPNVTHAQLAVCSWCRVAWTAQNRPGCACPPRDPAWRCVEGRADLAVPA